MLRKKVLKLTHIGVDLFNEFIESEKTGGYILILLTIISMTIANSAFGLDYNSVWNSHVNLSLPGIDLNYSITHWINDGLMAIFFLLVGLEIEREIYIGELSTIKKASLPAIAAVGGMLVPAAIHFIFNYGLPSQTGFGIPMATDIAFALGILSLLGNKIPLSVKIFLTALAIIDDLGAIIVIGLFYTSNLSIVYLLGSLGIFSLLLIMNKLKVYRLSPYLILGVIMWYFMLKSGVHSTISGVLLAFAIPFNKSGESNISYVLQKRLHKPVAFFILPLFVLANTVVVIPDDISTSLISNNSLGIIIGLVFGKPIGIFIFSYFAVKLGVGILSNGLNWHFLFGTACLAGIGFTMSIFITNLAFKEIELVAASKLSIIIASTVSAIFGLLILMSVVRKRIHSKEKNNL